MGTASHALGTARSPSWIIRKVHLVRWRWCYAGYYFADRTVPFPDYSGSNGLNLRCVAHF